MSVGSTDVNTAGVLVDEVFSSVDARLRATDQLLTEQYPGERPDRQAVHTVYVPADTWEPDLPQQWGAQALAAVEEHGGLEQLARRVIERAYAGESAVAGIPAPLENLDQQAAELAAAVEKKLRNEPIEDLRIDFEDGFGDRPDSEEDHWAAESAQRIREALEQGSAPAFYGIRFKCMEAPVRRRGLKTLDLFLANLKNNDDDLPAGLVLTLPKVSTVDQVTAMVEVARALEAAHGLAERRITFEVQVETPQVILGPDGTVPSAQLLHAGDGRITSLHYGTYDYSASLGIAAAYQAMDHPAADFAKQLLLLATAGTGVHLSDGSTNIIPVGEPEHVRPAWDLHSDLVRRHLQRGIYQGWDMHPNQLPTRFLATFHFFREGFASAARRISAYVHGVSGAVMDEPATAKALARYLQRGVVCGAIGAEELAQATQLAPEQLDTLARTGKTDSGA